MMHKDIIIFMSVIFRKKMPAPPHWFCKKPLQISLDRILWYQCRYYIKGRKFWSRPYIIIMTVLFYRVDFSRRTGKFYFKLVSSYKIPVAMVTKMIATWRVATAYMTEEKLFFFVHTLCPTTAWLCADISKYCPANVPWPTVICSPVTMWLFYFWTGISFCRQSYFRLGLGTSNECGWD